MESKKIQQTSEYNRKETHSQMQRRDERLPVGGGAGRGKTEGEEEEVGTIRCDKLRGSAVRRGGRRQCFVRAVNVQPVKTVKHHIAHL